MCFSVTVLHAGDLWLKGGFGDRLSEFLLMAVTMHVKASFIFFHSKPEIVFESQYGPLYACVVEW
jgi:hypothetical protein